MFAFGEKVLLIDAKKRRYLFTLKPDGEFHTHSGFLAHSVIVSEQEGAVVRSTKGAEYILLRPTLEDFVIQMPRGAQVIYPKDLAPICMMADIYQGAKVFE
jgi:tRNA (adenine57-N1/adenine58-N1)-methyltransferase